MNPYVNEEVAWQHIQDLQREMENSRLLAGRNPGTPVVAVVGLGRRRLFRLGKSAWNLLVDQLHRHSPEAELDGGDPDRRQEIA